jgi:hypothetical protein
MMKRKMMIVKGAGGRQLTKVNGTINDHLRVGGGEASELKKAN